MKHYKISKLINDKTVSKFVAKYSVNKYTRFETSMLRSDFCDSRDAYIVVKGRNKYHR